MAKYVVPYSLESILRSPVMVRFACELGWERHPDTWENTNEDTA